MKRFSARWFSLGVVNSALLFLATLCSAAAESNTYFNFDAGLNVAADVDVKFLGFGQARGRLEPGFRVSAAEGFVLNRFLSLEVETGFIYNNLEDFDGWLGHVPILASVVCRYDCKCGWTPFIGVGGGGALSLFEETVRFPTPAGSVSETETDADFVLAWQGQAGLLYRFNAGLSAGFLYKYFGTDGPEIEMFGVTRDFQINHNHYVGLQLNYRF